MSAILQKTILDAISMGQSANPMLDVKNISKIVYTYSEDMFRPEPFRVFLHMFFHSFQSVLYLSVDHKQIGVQQPHFEDYEYDDLPKGCNLTYYEAYMLFELLAQIDMLDVVDMIPNTIAQIKYWFPDYEERESLSLRDFLMLPLFQPFTLYNPSGYNDDERSTGSTDQLMPRREDDENYLLFDIKPSSVKFNPKASFGNNYKVFELLLGYLKIRSSKYDRWYELYCGLEIINEHNFKVCMDHGS